MIIKTTIIVIVIMMTMMMITITIRVIFNEHRRRPVGIYRETLLPPVNTVSDERVCRCLLVISL